MPRLEVLDASGASLRAIHVDETHGLRAANLSRTYITHQTLVALAGLPNLQELDIANTPVTGAGLGLLPAGLAQLSIDPTVLDEQGVSCIARLPNLKHLRLPTAKAETEKAQQLQLREHLGDEVDIWFGPFEPGVLE